MRLMIVEDNSGMRKAIRTMVASPHDVVLECSDGDEAVSAYAAFHPDWVLMDFEMPRVDGITATARIIAADPRARVLVVSQHDDEEVQHAAVTAGAKQFVAKQDLSKIKQLITYSHRGKL